MGLSLPPGYDKFPPPSIPLINLDGAGWTDIVALASTDVIPVGRPGNTTQYQATMAEVGAYASAYVTANLTKLDNRLLLGTKGSVEGAFSLASKNATMSWNFTTYEYTFNTHPDQVLVYGFNRNQNVPNGYDDFAQPGIYEGFEHDYWYDALHHVAEWYIEYRSANGTRFRRPFQASIRHDIDEITITIEGNVNYKDSTGAVDILGLTSLIMYAYKDMQFHPNTKGPVLEDRADGHTYRIKVTNGVLGAELVS